MEYRPQQHTMAREVIGAIVIESDEAKQRFHDTFDLVLPFTQRLIFVCGFIQDLIEQKTPRGNYCLLNQQDRLVIKG